MQAAKNSATPAAEPQPYTIATQDKSRWWEVRDAAGELVCLTSTAAARARWCAG